MFHPNAIGAVAHAVGVAAKRIVHHRVRQWHDERPVVEQLRYGVCAAAANLSEETCTGGLRPLADCLKLGERYGFRS